MIISDCGLVDSNTLSKAVAEEIKRLCKKKNSSYEFINIKNNPFGRMEWVVRKKDEISVSDFLFSISRTEEGDMGICKIFFYAKDTFESPNQIKEFYMKNYSIHVQKHKVPGGDIHKGLVNGISTFLFIINLLESWQKNNPNSIMVAKNVEHHYYIRLLNILSKETRKLILPDEIFQKQITISLSDSQISFWMDQGVEFILRFNQDTWGFDFIINKHSDESPLKKIILEEDLNIHPGPNLLANIDETMSNSLLRTLEEKFLKYYV